MKRCIICKKEIIEFGKACYFILGDGSSGPYYPFAQRSETGSFRHLRIERGFWNEQIHLRLNSVYVSYLKYDWSAAMCAYGVSNYSGYGRLSSIPEKYTVCSPWFDTENDKDSLQKGLAELGAWYIEHLPEINLSYEKQQTWLDKDYRDAKITRAYLDEHLSELTEPEISEIVCKEKIYTDCSDYDNFKKSMTAINQELDTHGIRLVVLEDFVYCDCEYTVLKLDKALADKMLSSWSSENFEIYL